MPRNTLRRAVAAIVLASVTLVAGARLAPVDGGSEQPATIVVDAASSSGTIRTVLGTQFVWPGLDAGESRTRFASLAPPLVRINATTVGAPDLPVVLPAGIEKGDWDFRNLDAIVSDIHAVGAETLLTIAYAPQWMWSCPAGTIRDGTFGEFAAYAARLVGYYNVGSFEAEDGRVIVNPAGTSHRIASWELWNEPDQPTMGCPPGGNRNITVPQYVAMWNAASTRMLAVDPTIRLVGPATSAAITTRVPDYLPALMSGAVRKPDVVSFHAYGGWKNSQTDASLFDGQGGCCGLVGAMRGLAQVKAWAPGIPIWVTELNINAAYDVDDPAARPWTAISAAWGASAFRQLAMAGVDAVLQYAFVHPRLRQFSLVDAKTGRPALPYWRDYELARAFPQGSTIVASSGGPDDVEVLAARPPGSSDVHVLVVNRRIDSASAIGGPGLAATVRIAVDMPGGVRGVTERVLDASTPVEGGPPAVALSPSDSVVVALSGYGAVLLEFVSGAATNAPRRAPTTSVRAAPCFAAIAAA